MPTPLVPFHQKQSVAPASHQTGRIDVCVIGGGPAGYAAAMRALDFGLNVVLVERKSIGGAGVYDGALTSKTLWELSTNAHQAKARAEKYFQQCELISFDEVMNEVREAIYERKSMLEHHLYHLKRSDTHRFAVINGTAHFIDQHTIEIVLADGTLEVVEANHFILATGSRPRYLPHLPIDEKIVMTSDGIKNLIGFPPSLVILGAGVIGCEFTTIFSNFGRTKVQLICRESRILAMEDPDLSAVVEASLVKNGVMIHKNAVLRNMEIRNGRVHYELCLNNDQCCWYEADKALVSVGRVPNVEDLDIDAIGIKRKPNGFIDDDDTRTSIDHIYAVGDLTADISLVNVGELEGRHAAELIAGQNPEPVRYDNVSTIMFLNPEIAGVGLNELQAQAQDIPYRMAVLDYSNIARAVAMRNTLGYFKILVTDEPDPQILGMRAVGEHASSAIQAVALMIATGTTISCLADMIHPHPSIVEGVQEALRMLLDRPIFKDWYPNPYHKVVRWDPSMSKIPREN